VTGPAQIQFWPVGGSVWLRAQDVTAAMRARAEELRRQADQLDASVSMALTS
jgi:hypothetical protein